METKRRAYKRSKSRDMNMYRRGIRQIDRSPCRIGDCGCLEFGSALPSYPGFGIVWSLS